MQKVENRTISISLLLELWESLELEHTHFYRALKWRKSIPGIRPQVLLRRCISYGILTGVWRHNKDEGVHIKWCSTAEKKADTLYIFQAVPNCQC